ncbi:MAG: aminopeptidase P N-terminal domain-containing protein [Saprospiraceae bacterium]|nr:aminopeptidase P N-terminal domain-containing protein [Saprospiraceae bacterium]
MKYKAINPELFKLNRERFCAHMKPNSIAIFQANDLLPRNGDCHFPFRQNSDLFYLCGLDQEEVVLVLYPNCPKGKQFEELIFTKKTNDYIKIWEGYKYTQEDAAKVSAVANVMWTENMDSVLKEMIQLADNIYVNTNENDRAHSEVDERNARLAKSLRAAYPAHEFMRAQPIMKKLRMIKSTHEVEVMQEACNITEKAFRRVLATTKVGMTEYEVEANVIYEFIRNGASGHAYTPIIASGANACVLHYIANESTLKDGEVMLMDFGAEYGNYAADLSRSIPVNGRYTERQKAVYNAVLHVKKEAEKMLVAGTTLTEYHKEVGLIMQAELVNLGLITATDIKNQRPEWPAYKKYFMHGTSHHLGLDVHDLAERYVPFQNGMVFTCEPGIYIPEENLGIRIEDDILITENGPVNLMKNIPIEADHIEELMNA